MKKLLFLTFLTIPICFNNFAQTTITLQPGADIGKDVLINSVQSNINFGQHPELSISTWTAGGVIAITRELIDFVELKELPPNISILSAELYLYHSDFSTNGFKDGKHYPLDGSTWGYIKRITSDWDESSVTWNYQPAIGEVIGQIQAPTYNKEDLVIDVKDYVQSYVDNRAYNFGMYLMLGSEAYYKIVTLASSDNSDDLLHPKLEVTYQVNENQGNDDQNNDPPCEVTVYDTVQINIYNTVENVINVYDTIINFMTIYDTIDVQNLITVYDTIRLEKLIQVFDSVRIDYFVNIYDTITIENVHEIYDTIEIQNIIPLYDTIRIEKLVEVYDTIPQYISVQDTLVIDVWLSTVPSNQITATIKVYPNPTYHDLNISIQNLDLLMNYKIDIVNSKGQSIFLTNIDNNNYVVSFDKFRERGLYFVNILNSDYKVVETKKILLK